jgi:phage FluMu protein Com
MPTKTFKCANCNKTLAEVDSICSDCDAKLAAESGATVPPGKHNCPVCRQSFGKPAVTLWPEVSKWYAPRTQRLQCPHCKTLLLDTRNPRLPTIHLAILLVAILVAKFGLPQSYSPAALTTIALLIVVFYVRRRSWNVPDSRRYVRDEA